MFGRLVWIVMGYGVEIWGWEEREKMERLQARYLRWVMGVDWGILGYMVREEVQRMMLREKGAVRAWGWEMGMEEGRGIELARRYWEEMRERERVVRREKVADCEKERREYLGSKDWKMEEIEEWRGKVEWVKEEMERKEKEEQSTERWEKIEKSEVQQVVQVDHAGGSARLFKEGMGRKQVEESGKIQAEE